MAALTVALAGSVGAQNQPDSQRNERQNQPQIQNQNRDRAGADANQSAVGKPMAYHKASGLLGMTVNDQTGEKIGDIKDLAVDLQSGRVAYTVFGTDGRERLFAIPLAAYKPGADQKHLVLQVDKQKFESAQGFDRNAWPALSAQVQTSDTFWQMQLTAQGAATYEETGKDNPQRRSDPQQTQPGTAAGASGTVMNHNKASKLLGMDVKNQQNEEIGEIKDFVVDFQAGKISYIVLAHGGTLGIGEKLLAVPPAAFRTGAEQQDFLVLNANKQKLEQAKGFDKENWPSVSNPNWGANIFWEGGLQGQGQIQTTPDANRNPNQNDPNRNPNQPNPNRNPNQPNQP